MGLVNMTSSVYFRMTTNLNQFYGYYNFVDYYNENNYPVIIDSLTMSICTGKGTYYAGDHVTGNGNPISLVLHINGYNNYPSNQQTTSLQAGETSGFIPYGQITDRKTFTFGSSPVIQPGETVQIWWRYTGTDTGTVLGFLNNDKDEEYYQGAHKDHWCTISVSRYYPPITGSVSIVAHDQTILYGKTTSVDYEVTVSGVPDGYIQEVTGDGSLGTITGKKTGTVTVKITHPDYSGSLSDSDSYTINCKLNTPSASLSSSTGGFTIGTSVSPSPTDGNNPSGCTRNWQVSVDDQSWKDTSVPLSVQSGSRIKFKLYLSKSGYVDSDWSPATNNVDIFYEPRKMEANGFVDTFEYKSPGQDWGDIPGEGEVVVPTGSLRVTWSSFLVSKNLGRFNLYRFSVVESSTNEEVFSDGSSNTPSTSGSSEVVVRPEWAGKTCYLKLECMCKWPETGESSTYGPDEDTAVFVSSAFLIGGYPNVPKVIYPSKSSFNSDNKRLRLIFEVSNPDYLEGWKITDVEVEVNNGSKVMIYKYSVESQRVNFYSILDTKPDQIESKTSLDFTTPEECSISTGTTFRIRCSNQFLTSDWTSLYTLTLLGLEYMIKGRKLQKSDLLDVHSGVKEVLDGYSNFKEVEKDLSPTVKVGEDYLVTSSYYTGHEGILEILKSFYHAVETLSVPPREIRDSFNIDKVSTEETKDLKVEAVSPEFDEDTFYVPYGNYFNYIIYTLKNML